MPGTPHRSRTLHAPVLASVAVLWARCSQAPPRAPRRSTKVTGFYSPLRTIEANWGLGYLGNASDTLQVHAMTDLLEG